jgi:hypothetical protein
MLLIASPGKNKKDFGVVELRLKRAAPGGGGDRSRLGAQRASGQADRSPNDEKSSWAACHWLPLSTPISQ